MPKNPIPEVNNLFLLGAGFTKAIFPNAPLNKDLLPVLCKGTSCTTLKKYYRECNKIKDIEILLTYLDLEILRPKCKRQIALKQVRKDIERQLAEYFEQFRFGKGKHCNKDWLKCFAKEVFHPNDVIISINYDCFLEGLLDYHKMWSPINGYPSSINVGNYNGRLPENPEGIIIYKIHGSENFRLHKTNVSPVLCGELFESCKNRSYTQIHPAGPYIIAPSFVKIPHEDIERMMIEVLDVVDKAKNFIIIGCSMRPEDAFLWLLLTKFLCRPDKNGRIIIVDPHADSTKEKINSHYWGGNEVTNVVEIKGELQKEDILDELLKVVSK